MTSAEPGAEGTPLAPLSARQAARWAAVIALTTALGCAVPSTKPVDTGTASPTSSTATTPPPDTDPAGKEGWATGMQRIEDALAHPLRTCCCSLALVGLAACKPAPPDVWVRLVEDCSISRESALDAWRSGLLVSPPDEDCLSTLGHAYRVDSSPAFAESDEFDLVMSGLLLLSSWHGVSVEEAVDHGLPARLRDQVGNNEADLGEALFRHVRSHVSRIEYTGDSRYAMQATLSSGEVTVGTLQGVPGSQATALTGAHAVMHEVAHLDLDVARHTAPCWFSPSRRQCDDDFAGPYGRALLWADLWSLSALTLLGPGPCAAVSNEIEGYCDFVNDPRVEVCERARCEGAI